jgi:arylsulfatase A-like enzyme/Tfp pilus assembly protein PilF
MANKKKRKIEVPQAKVSKPRTNRWKILLPAVAVIALGISVFFYFRTPRKIQSGAFKDFNLLMITLDTTRADHLPMYGYKQVKTPNLDALARESYIFEDAIAHAPLTLPSHASMLTGLLPISHGIRDNAGFFLDQKVTTLPEILKSKGYATSAFVSAFVLDSRWKLNQGFDFYYDNFNLEEFKQLNPQDAQRPAEETTAEALHWLDAHAKQRFFSWVHFYDAHDPYTPPDPFKTEYADNPYDGEIAYMDVYVGKLLDKLKALGLKERTIVVLTGDHGEGLGQHEEITHAMFVYNATQHIPLLIHIPGAGHSRVKGVVRHIDMFPTILDLAALSSPKEVQGRSLLPLMNRQKDTGRVAYSESIYAELHYGWSPLKSITTEQYKYIDAPKPELYDRTQDPNETKNLIHEKSSYAKVLKDQLNELIAKYQSKNLEGPQKMDPETEEKLRALGYIGSTLQSTEASLKIDPKDKIHLAQGLQTASFLAQEQRYKESIETVLPVLQEDPDMTDGHFIAGVSYIGLKEYDKAIDALLKTILRRPDHTMALYNVGYAYELKGEKQEALDWFFKVLKYEPTHLYASLKIAHLYRMMNKPELARPYFFQAMSTYQRFLASTKSDKVRSSLHSTIGESYFGAGEFEKAEEHYKAAIDLTPDRKGLHYNLALIYEAKGNPVAAIEEYQKETEVNAQNFKAFNNLGLLYKQTRQFDRAALCFRKVVQLLPKDPRGYLLLASTLKEMGRVQEANAILQQAQGTRSQ